MRQIEYSTVGRAPEALGISTESTVETNGSGLSDADCLIIARKCVKLSPVARRLRTLYSRYTRYLIGSKCAIFAALYVSGVTNPV
jgi:hypothetical protein